MNGKQSKRARAIAYKEAQRQNLWKQGEDSIYSKRWNRFLSWLFPKRKAQWANAIGRWYKANLKKWAHEIARRVHDPDYAAMMRARKHIAKRHAAKGA